MRVRSRVVLVACAALSSVAGIASLSGSATAQGQAATQRVIVVFKNQDRGQPATGALLQQRRTSFRQTQAPVVSQLSSSGAKSLRSYSLIDAVSATVSPAQVSALKNNPAVSEVVPDRIIHLGPASPVGTGAGGSSASPGAVCSSGKPQLNPQALRTIHADSDLPGAQTARALGFDGSGVKVAFIADGLDINNPDFIRANGQKVFFDYKDFSGEGTGTPTGGEEAFGDAGSIAAQGRTTYNVAGYGPNGVKSTCNIRIEGVAPGASLAGLSIFGNLDAGYNSSLLQAIDYAVTTDRVNVLNESLGNNFYPDDQASLDLIKQANDAAVAAGVTVTASSGDAGVTNTIGTPSTDPNVLSVGASTTYRVNLQTGYGGAQFPGIKSYLNNDISSLSSGGFRQDGHTVDVVAPGELNWSLCSTNVAIYQECFSYAGNPTPVVPFGGTSESAPLTAGVAALVIQAYKKTHGVVPTPQVVKQIIAGSADDIGSPAEQQGAGLVDAYKAVQAAESYRAPASTPSPTGTTVVSGTPQLNAVDAPGTSETLSDTITNTGAGTQRVRLQGRTLGAYRTLTAQKVVLDDGASPKTVDWAGVPSNYEPVTFTVPAGQNRLNASIAFQGALANGLVARVRITLVDPAGDLAAYSVPQGNGNYGNVQVTNPRAGTWTAYVWSRVSGAGGTTGPVLFGAGVARYARFGTVRPAQLTLAPGQSKPVTLSVATPQTPGDSAGAIVVTGSAGPAFARKTTIPVTLRSLIPAGRQSFTQTLTGGNGRAFITGQEFYYQLDVGAGQPELNASIALANNPNNPFSAFLISPSGEALAFQANEFTSASTITDQLGAQLHVLNPAQGAWTLVVAFVPQVSGTALSEPFTVSTDQSAVPATGGDVPNAPGSKLTAGQATTYNLKVKNTGTAPEQYFVDPRLAQSAQLNLTSLTDPSTTVPLTFNQNDPLYLVPTETTAWNETAGTTGATPIQFDSQPFAGDPDIASNVGTSVSATFTDTPMAQGLWGVIPTVAGAFGPTGAPSEPVTTAMSVTTAAFDPTVSSQTGDLWQAAVDPSVLNGLSPVVVGPGQTGTIPVTITPTGASGTTVTGTLYVDDMSEVLFQTDILPNGDEVAAIPYSYTIK